MTSIDQQLDVVVATPIKAVKDPILLNKLENAFREQLTEIKIRAQECLRNDEHPTVVPTVPRPKTKASENDNTQETTRKAQHKRGRKTTTKRLLEVPFSFEPPTFCMEENIDLEIVLLNRFKEGESWGNYVSKFSVAERLQNWLLEKRERCKDKTKKNTSAHQDCYFHHLPSQKTLRSQTEVINFLLHGDFPRKSDSKKAKLTKEIVVDNLDSILTSSESSKRGEMSSHLPDRVNKINNTQKEENKKRMENENNSDGKHSNEMDSKVENNEMKNKKEDIKKEIMLWDDQIGMYKMVDNEIENGLMVEELLNQAGELLILKP